MNTTPTDHKIEFMAWNGKDLIRPKYGYWFFISGNRYVSLNDEYENVLCDNLEGVCELMQLTALRSINDEPIYNHMIVMDELSDYYLVDMFNYDLMFMLSESHIEIVGNRFQSPELLEMCK